ncbi:MAG: pyridoxine 5'-phosphate synthase [Bacteroidales bacterium]|jgi:pyridoxine 5-phosphate synthase|nr:pyridoxine 5'-phosphate synthase [Bacteroidales bacterium]
MTNLSVNINKIATIRNARGGNIPNILETAINCERFGAEGITVHPRPDERHIRYNDVFDLKPALTKEFNIEGYPSEKFLNLVCEIKPHQVTLVPDSPDALTSNAGWDTIKNKDVLSKIISRLKSYNIRTSIFVETDTEIIKHAADIGTDRIELYTEPFVNGFKENRAQAIEPFINAAIAANKVGLGINAGHDLNLENLEYFVKNIPGLLEVSIGHALISDALYFGLENTIQMYLRKVKI